MVCLVFQISILKRTTAETQMETRGLGASPPAHPNDGTSVPFPAAVSPHTLLPFRFAVKLHVYA